MTGAVIAATSSHNGVKSDKPAERSPNRS